MSNEFVIFCKFVKIIEIENKYTKSNAYFRHVLL